MDIYSSYKVKLHHCHARELAATTAFYRSAVDFLINVCLDRWADISGIGTQYEQVPYVESLCHKTKAHPDVPYDFDAAFYKFPTYMRRAAIAEAIVVAAIAAADSAVAADSEAADSEAPDASNT